MLRSTKGLDDFSFNESANSSGEESTNDVLNESFDDADHKEEYALAAFGLLWSKKPGQVQQELKVSYPQFDVDYNTPTKPARNR